MTTLDGNTFTVEEVTSADGGAPLRVALKGRDAPLGGRGSGGAFESKVETRQVERYYPGQDVPSRQVMGVKWAPIVVNGNLQDRGVVGRAREIVETLQRMAQRKRRVRISWGPWAYFGLVDYVTAKPEGLRDFNYELSLHIDGPDLGSSAPIVGSLPGATPADLAEDATAARAFADVPLDKASEALPASEYTGITEARLLYLEGLDALLTVTELLDGGITLTPADVGRVEAAAVACASSSIGLSGVLVVPPPADLGWQRAVAWQRAQSDASEGAWTAAETSVRVEERLDSITRGNAEAVIYTRDGETLESLARTRLGDEGRAAEIARRNGLTGHRLDAGTRLVLPTR